MSPADEKEIRSLVAAMTPAEKVELVSGCGLWRTAAIDRLGIKSILMTDGTYGVRYSTTQIDAGDDAENGLAAFLDVVNQQADDTAGMFGTTRPATCFPNGNLVGCSWDLDLLYRMGEALARECRSLGIHLLLGPGINTRRTPLAGRAYEYYSEDPVINGELAAALISGLQDNGIGASLKHFACNNSEIERTTTSSDVDERALREIYLAGFERAIAKSAPWTVMSAYNPVNGVQAAENPWLLQHVLRDEWGYDGLVLSDWHAIKDRPASLVAGSDLDMPESKPRKARLLAAIEAGKVDESRLDEACARVIGLAHHCQAGAQPAVPADLDLHHALARQIAAESIVLLRNEHQTLPLDATASGDILVVGDGALLPTIQGSGSATTNPFRVDSPFTQIAARASPDLTVRHVAFPGAEDATLGFATQAVLAAASSAQVVIVFAENEKARNGEGNDRDSLRLAAGHDQLIRALADARRKVIVVLTMPDAVEMPWLDRVDAILACFYPGQGGGEAVSRVLFGEQNPCGKLTTTMPARLEDIPGWHTYPGENSRHLYSEGTFVGYRFYDLKAMPPLFPFGHGMSYTQFSYEEMVLDRQDIGPSMTCTASITIRNSGSVVGKEIVQLYVRPVKPGLRRPIRELKAFAKIALHPGEVTVVALPLAPRDFQYFDVSRGTWVLEAEAFVIEAAASSRDIRLECRLGCVSETFPPVPLSTLSPPSLVFANAKASPALTALLMAKLDMSEPNATALLNKLDGSFLGFYDTLSWYIGDEIAEADIEALFTALNEGELEVPKTGV
ncbi:MULTISPECIES: beta-glucosidase [Rhizobium]|uniref:Glycoside hydrolase family 3 C-terminal domain-containing protein n=1 Tax=Rhizobium rhododendri TaxID=2506430 RepID=A0ABY8IP17_9HYPH|nr:MULTISPECIES: glycoside hydrolase family 3 C-terminal domain-containing protein [Rhizobium]MBO9101049.1 glycoside hydrolase family 3 C-terminal domain-containing protein [Rhizobium sp. L58/93]MBO9135393.1 glycoside hydrolase family 3 C-terminal domain-containing protein [Rhizobium sp. B209b/85]MBO9171617.1 glycoside hydrolase family 3 C-terminal domain-containing protein [Rhizobium sp. L245/93]MBO9186637.1 glycoside hydrolase family 3 C-terminal domain-containing protein [Rhizobium sp. E27B/